MNAAGPVTTDLLGQETGAGSEFSSIAEECQQGKGLRPLCGFDLLIDSGNGCFHTLEVANR